MRTSGIERHDSTDRMGLCDLGHKPHRRKEGKLDSHQGLKTEWF